MRFLGIEPARGEVRRGRARVGSYADGTPVEIPVIVASGMEDGPTAYLQAGIHGDETTAIELCRRVVAAIDVPMLKGIVAVVPIGNVPAYLTRSRSWVHEERGPIDMNRIFPGDRDGLLTEQIAAAIVDGFLTSADYAIDFHSALGGCIIHPCVYVSGAAGHPVRDVQDRVASAMAFGLTCVQDGLKEFGHTNLSRSFASVAESMNVPAVVAEMGESGRITEAFLPVGVSGTIRALAAMGNLDHADVAVEQSVRFRSIEFIHAPRGGLISQRRRLGEPVRAGDELAAVIDPYTGDEAVVTAPRDGIVFRQMTHGGCASGAELVWLASDPLGSGDAS